MFVRGGVYVVVRDSMGPTVAKLSVSALVVDYILTGPISVVSAGQYLGRLLNELSEAFHQTWRTNPNYFAVFFSVVVTVLLLVVEHQRRPRVEHQGAAHHADHHGHGRDPADLVPAHAGHAQAIATLPPLPTPSNIHLATESHGMAPRNLLGADFLRRDGRGVRPLHPRHERIRDARPGVPRNRLSQAQEPAPHRQHRLHLLPDLHRRDLRFRRDDHSRCGPQHLLRQPDRRRGGEPRRTCSRSSSGFTSSS